MKKLRLDKFLGDSLVGSRADVKKYIYWNRIKVNGKIIKDPGFKVDPERDEISYKDEKVLYEPFRYYILNKPSGYVTAIKDKDHPTVMELLKDVNTKDLFPVGRLDKDTEGLLLITNDGKLSHDLLSPKKHVEKSYIALSDRKLSPEDIKKIESGIDIGDDKPCLPAKISYLGEEKTTEKEGELYSYELTIREGRYHQVKRMFKALGGEVIKLKRISFGRLKLGDDLKPGEYRKITWK
ncbi:MAG: rRNA pseudouridine synthase [Lachnospiraceae bacterium]|nr:rRNA pseudouridine synthase [Lachnospiraceae bacterium]